MKKLLTILLTKASICSLFAADLPGGDREDDQQGLQILRGKRLIPQPQASKRQKTQSPSVAAHAIRAATEATEEAEEALHYFSDTENTDEASDHSYTQSWRKRGAASQKKKSKRGRTAGSKRSPTEDSDNPEVVSFASTESGSVDVETPCRASADRQAALAAATPRPAYRSAAAVPQPRSVAATPTRPSSPGVVHTFSRLIGSPLEAIGASQQMIGSPSAAVRVLQSQAAAAASPLRIRPGATSIQHRALEEASTSPDRPIVSSNRSQTYNIDGEEVSVATVDKAAEEAYQLLKARKVDEAEEILQKYRATNHFRITFHLGVLFDIKSKTLKTSRAIKEARSKAFDFFSKAYKKDESEFVFTGGRAPVFRFLPLLLERSQFEQAIKLCEKVIQRKGFSFEGLTASRSIADLLIKKQYNPQTPRRLEALIKLVLPNLCKGLKKTQETPEIIPVTSKALQLCDIAFKRNREIGVKLYKYMADVLEIPEANEELGDMYLFGEEGLECDKHTAMRYYDKLPEPKKYIKRGDALSYRRAAKDDTPSVNADYKGARTEYKQAFSVYDQQLANSQKAQTNSNLSQQRLRMQIANLTTERKTLESEKTKLEARVSTLEKTELLSKHIRYEKAFEELDTLKEKAKEEAKKPIAELEEENAGLKEKLSQLEKTIEEQEKKYKEENVDLKEKLSQLEEKSKDKELSYKEEKSSLEERFKKLLEEKQQLAAEKDAAQKKAAKAEEKLKGALAFLSPTAD